MKPGRLEGPLLLKLRRRLPNLPNRFRVANAALRGRPVCYRMHVVGRPVVDPDVPVIITECVFHTGGGPFISLTTPARR